MLCIAGVALSLTYMTTGVSAMQHFNRNRSLAAGITTLGTSTGYLISPFPVTHLIRVYGWRGSMVILAGIMANIVALGALMKSPISRKRNSMPVHQSVSNCDDIDSAMVDIQHFEDSEVQYCEITSQNPISAEYKRDDDINVYHSEHLQGDEVITGPSKIRSCNTNNALKLEETSISTMKHSGRPNMHAKRTREFFKDVFDFTLLKYCPFLTLCISAMLGTYGHRMFLNHMPSKVVSLGFSKDDAAAIMSIFSMSALCSRLVVTILANIQGVNRIILFGCGLLVGALANCLTLIHSFTGLAIAAATFGMQLGKIWTYKL